MAVAAFPDVRPTSRVWTPGAQPVKSYTALSGFEARVLLGVSPIGGSLTLRFQNIVENTFLLFTDHFALAQGTYEVFSLSANTYAGLANFSSVTPSGYLWRYASAPSVEWVSSGIGNVSVTLTAVRV
jgi:hypothetical protein